MKRGLSQPNVLTFTRTRSSNRKGCCWRTDVFAMASEKQSAPPGLKELHSKIDAKYVLEIDFLSVCAFASAMRARNDDQPRAISCRWYGKPNGWTLFVSASTTGHNRQLIMVCT